MTPSQPDYESLFASTTPPKPDAVNPLAQQFKYDFAIAFADGETFPGGDLVEALESGLEEEGDKLAIYPHPQGHAGMRQLVAENLGKNRGMKVGAEDVTLTAGSMQALVLLTELFVDPGDTVLTDEFIYNGTIRVMRRFQANIVEVGGDDQAMRPDLLEETIVELKAAGERIKYIYTVPTFQNPTGLDMGTERRAAILEVGRRHGIPIFEDDCYAELRFEGEATPAIHSMDDGGSVMYCGSSSKIIGPGMRLGWIVAPPEITERVGTLQQGATPSQFSILAAYNYLKKHRDLHVAGMVELYKSRKDVMLAAIRENFGPGVECSNPPGGMFLWLRFPEGTDVMPVLEKAKEQGIRFGAGPIFSPSGKGRNYLRLAFAHQDEGTIREGIAKLAALF